MSGLWSFAPRSTPANCTECSSRTPDYNCLAFAAGDTNQWWEPYVIPPVQPGVFWPANVHPDNRVQDWTAALATVGFTPCVDGALEPSLVKVAILGHGETAKHATRQLVDGTWVSKLGDLEDIRHSVPADVGGGEYGEVICFLCRARAAQDP